MAGTENTTGLEQMICFDLYAASRAMTGLYRPALDALGLTYPQYVALRVIWHRDNLTVRELGAALQLDSGTLSPLLKRLETQGLIQRRRGTDDERTVRISTTAQGSALQQRVADLPERLACALDLTLDESTQLHHLLGRIRGTAAATTI
ncbi:MarR family winged helix-turn-helix transcriptional regulator [Actinoplanes friuliensis]|uniref:Putative MarR-family transcriptional regulator n=1 Tax=Actinoplanes friuliensis DSM 7358 TaxID=1246995 RepID=U5W043_9ACTN|nr:MarR family transcriptional regulator [Actinoplanes friuliensis]AGZ42568.1 putative MarR-family transcriptional regulator [Actinoplanes friuliensis DSM 7358]